MEVGFRIKKPCFNFGVFQKAKLYFDTLLAQEENADSFIDGWTKPEQQ